jgi:hypothetical protein
MVALGVTFDKGCSRKRQEQADERRRRRGWEFSFLMTEANGVVGPVHPKAMPVLLTTAEEWRAWLKAPVDEPPAAAAAARGRGDGRGGARAASGRDLRRRALSWKPRQRATLGKRLARTRGADAHRAPYPTPPRPPALPKFDEPLPFMPNATLGGSHPVSRA